MKEQIKKGDWFKCVADFIMNSGEIAYTKGRYYKSEVAGCITDDQGCSGHVMRKTISDDNIHFQKLYTLQDLKDDKVSISTKFTTIKQLNKLLKLIGIIPVDNIKGRYISVSEVSGLVFFHNYTSNPVQLVEEFLVQHPEHEHEKKQLSNIESLERELSHISHSLLVVGHKNPNCDYDQLKKTLDETPDLFKIGHNYFFSNNKTDWHKGELLAFKPFDDYPYKVYLYDGTLEMFKYISKKIVVTSKEIAEMKGCNVEDLIIQY